MSICIRQAEESDFAAVLGLIKDLAAFQRTPDKVTNTVEQMIADKELFRCLVAENEQELIVGIASYFFVYYTWNGKSLYMDDLYVAAGARGKKIGSLLLAELFKIAKAENCKRVRWQVSDWNEPAIAFYKKLGAYIDKEPYNCDFDETAMLACKPMDV